MILRSGLALLFASLATLRAAPAAKPNIVVILVDDMGFSDLGCYGSEIPTPNLDALAASGLRFTQFYNTGRCCPSRAALLTGLYSHQAGVGHMVEDKGAPGYVGHLNESCVTIAEALKPAGYFTAFSGKWHVGQQAGVTPSSRGFDRSLNAPAGGFYDAKSPRAELFLDGAKIQNDDPRLPANWYTTDLWTTFGLKFIDEALAEKKPFYLHLCYNAPHFPLQAPAAEIAEFRGKYMAGWSAIGQARYEREKQLGLIGEVAEKAPLPQKVKDWNQLGSDEKDRFDHIMAVYAAVLHHMDKAVGELVAGLKQRGALDNTLILFMSDNGGCAESGPDGRNQGDPTQGGSDWFCGESWAWLQNTPFRLYKHYNHEGGIATPLIAHWPQGIHVDQDGSGLFSRKAPGGPLCHQPAHLIDIMPTCVDVAGASYPKEFGGHAILPMEGASLKNLFLGGTIERGPLFWEHEGNAAVRVGDDKLVRYGRDGAWELYDMHADRSELHNLEDQQPDKAKALAAKWEAWAERAHVKPYPAGGKKRNKPKQKAE